MAKISAKFPVTIHDGRASHAPGDVVTIEEAEFDRIAALFGGEKVAKKSKSDLVAEQAKAEALAAAEKAVGDAAERLTAAVDALEAVNADDAAALAAAETRMTEAQDALSAAEAARDALKG